MVKKKITLNNEKSKDKKNIKEDNESLDSDSEIVISERKLILEI